MVSALVSGSSGPGSSPGRGHCVVFLGKTLYSHSASLHSGVYSCFEKGCLTNEGNLTRQCRKLLWVIVVLRSTD